MVLSIDIDEDSYDKNIFKGADKVSWRGVEEGIPKILETLKDYQDANGRSIRYSWFVRCDRQLEGLYGDPGYLFKQYHALWNERKGEGDEIAWHFHPYDHDYSLMNNEAQLVKDLKMSYLNDDFKRYGINASRIGRAFCSNAIIAELCSLGIKVDSTALPGRKRKDKVNSLDWEISSQAPFFPSGSDYRIPGKDQTDLLEIPMSMIETKASYDKEPLKRYMNLTFKNEVINNSLRKHVRDEDLLVSIMHPSEVIASQTHPLLSFDKGEIKRNIEVILSEAGKNGRKVNFITISDVLDLVKQGKISYAN